MDHSDDEQMLERLAAEVSRTDPRWNRRWRLAQAFMPGPAPSWTALAASGALLLLAAVLLLVTVASGQTWLWLLVLAVFAVGMQPVAHSTRRQQLRPARAALTGQRRHRRPADRPDERPNDGRGF